MPKLSQNGQQQIQEILDSSTKGTGVPGLVFCAVDRSGELLAQQHSGQHGPLVARPMDQDSVFWIASCTKMITAIACMQLVEQGKLDLDSSKQLYELLPEVKAKDQVLVGNGKWEARKGDITLRMLLSHIAGFGYSFFNERLRDYSRPTGFDEFDVRAFAVADVLYAMMLTQTHRATSRMSMTDRLSTNRAPAGSMV